MLYDDVVALALGHHVLGFAYFLKQVVMLPGERLGLGFGGVVDDVAAAELNVLVLVDVVAGVVGVALVA